MLQFDEQRHLYFLDGLRLSSVTELIEWAGLVTGTEWFTPDSRERGSAVHMAIHYLNDGGLDPASIDPRIEGYLAGYEKFRRETGFQPIEIIDGDTIRPAAELRLCNALRGYAGTLDTIGPLNCEDTLIDYKSGGYSRWMDVQLELYWRMVAGNAKELGIIPPARRAVVQFTKDGAYKIHTPKADNASWARQMADALERLAETRLRIRMAA